jgi:UDP-N-acetylglucosamine:LPS N-acetylglucosamine transferase
MQKDRVDFVQQTVDKMLTDEACLNQMKKVFKVWLKPMSGKEVAQEMKGLKAISKGDVEAAQTLLKTKYRLGK